MKKKDFIGFIKNVQNSMQKHSPEILTGVGIAGMITTVIMAVRATPKAVLIMEEEKYDNNVETLTPIEVIRTTWKCYVPSAIVGMLSTGCLIGASSVNFRRNTALATAYSLSESALRTYQEKVVETIGTKKEEGIRNSIAKDKLDAKPVTSCEVIFTDGGDTLCFDPMFGRYFRSDIDTIKKAVNELNRQMLSDMFVSLNDFYYEIGADGIRGGDDLGWNVNDGFIDIGFSAQIANDKTPCIVIDYRLEPKYDYHR